MSDARNTAWLAAWERLAGANKLKADCAEHLPDLPLPEWYWVMLAEAAIYAELAKAPTEVGFCTGDWLEERDRRKRDELAHVEKLLAKGREGATS